VADSRNRDDIRVLLEDSMLGILAITLFVILSAGRDVFFSDELQSAPFFVVALVAFGTCSIVFLAISLLERRRSLHVIFADPLTLVCMNTFTATAWLSYFYSIRTIEPAITATIHAGIGPLVLGASAALGIRIVDLGTMSRLEAACQRGILGTLVYMVGVAYLGHAATGAEGVPALIGCMFAVVSGTSITLSLLFSKRMHEGGASAAAVVATRFVGIVAVAAIVLSMGVGSDYFASETPASLGRLAMMAFVLMAVPLYVNQVGTKLCSPTTVKVMLSLGPVALIALQSIVGGLDLSPYSLAGVLAYSTFACLAVAARLAHGLLDRPAAQT